MRRLDWDVPEVPRTSLEEACPKTKNTLYSTGTHPEKLLTHFNVAPRILPIFPAAPGRNLWYQTHNIQPPRLNPGGWSSHGQPVDQCHGCYRAAIRYMDLVSTGQVLNLRCRQRCLNIDLGIYVFFCTSPLCVYSSTCCSVSNVPGD